MIKGYAYQGDYGRVVNLLVGSVTSVEGGEYFRPYDFAAGRILAPVEIEEGVQPETVCTPIPTEIAEEMYHALDRVFGRRDDTPAIAKDVLAKEQSRVDRMIDVLVDIARPG